ncbi:secreted antigen 1 [Babesia divergens]|uniref:Secreted antigen 1 n=1 Tax=Babesia divergens TaxID=32595 RepID=A0AAD9G7T5_BABDI|nr:secreted antigen 1 [Babesia divergens]
MGSQDLSGMYGGQWHDQNVNGSGLSNNDLCNWLTKVENLSRTLTPGLVKRGFSGLTLTSNTAENVAGNIENILTHNNPGPLQKVLASLLLACEWDPSLLGHALCFLSMFCVTVQSPQKNFEGYSEELKDVCRELSGSLQPFVQGSSQSHISAVSQGTSNVYSGVFKDDSLDDYCDWLRKNLKNIIEALKDMSEKCKTWGTSTPFQMGFTAGPFLYGFVPKDKSWMNHIKENLQGPITSLIESLEKLENALQTSSSAGATAGGVFTGLFGLGGAGAGAAYGFNLFGLKNLVTGLLK